MADDDDMLRGLPVTRHDPLTWPGAMDQYRKMADAPRSQTGRRRIMARIGIALIALAVMMPLIAMVITRL